MADKTYVYEGIEVRKTGKTASKQLSSGRTDELVEVTPVDKMQGSWHKWARPTDLFEVSQGASNE